MNKKLIAAAVAAGLAAPLAANAEVTVYGQLQAEIGQLDATGVNYNGVAAGESAIKIDDMKRGRLGFKASEDLGNGLTALAKFEWQVETTTGDVNDGQRETLVGLRGGFGEVQFGRLKSAYKYSGGVSYDPFVTTFLESRTSSGVQSGGMSGGSFGHNGFLSDTVAYVGKFGNIGAWVTYGVDEGNGDVDEFVVVDGAPVNIRDAGNMGDLTAALKFDGGNFEAFVAHASQDSTELAMNKIGGQFKMAGLTLSAQYEDGTNANDQDQNWMFLGAQYALGKNVLVAQFGQSEFDATPANDADYLAVGVIHKMSKQTRVFAGYRNTDADAYEVEAVTAGMRVVF